MNITQLKDIRLFADRTVLEAIQGTLTKVEDIDSNTGGKFQDIEINDGTGSIVCTFWNAPDFRSYGFPLRAHILIRSIPGSGNKANILYGLQTRIKLSSKGEPEIKVMMSDKTVVTLAGQQMPVTHTPQSISAPIAPPVVPVPIQPPIQNGVQPPAVNPPVQQPQKIDVPSPPAPQLATEYFPEPEEVERSEHYMHLSDEEKCVEMANKVAWVKYISHQSAIELSCKFPEMTQECIEKEGISISISLLRSLPAPLHSLPSINTVTDFTDERAGDMA